MRLLSYTYIAIGVGLIVLQAMAIQSVFADTEITEDNRYVYISTPWVDFTRQERVEALTSAKRMVMQVLEDRIPYYRITKDLIKKFSNTSDRDITESLQGIEKWLNEHQDRLNRFGFRAQDLIPSALIISVNGSGLTSARARLGATAAKEIAEAGKKKPVGGLGLAGANFFNKGGSITIAFIIVPFMLTKIDKLTKKIIESKYRFKVSVVGIPDVAIVVHGSSDARLDMGVGVGFVFGELDDPKDFGGFSFGYSLIYRFSNKNIHYRADDDGLVRLGYYDGNVWKDAKGRGLNIKVAALKRSLKGLFQNVYVIASSRFGVTHNTDHELSTGPVLKINKIMELITGQDMNGLEASRKTPDKQQDEQHKPNDKPSEEKERLPDDRD